MQGFPADATVERVLSEVRLALFGILLSIGLSVGFGVPGSWWVGVASGVAAVVLAAVALRVGGLQRALADLMHWTLGR